MSRSAISVRPLASRTLGQPVRQVRGNVTRWRQRDVDLPAAALPPGEDGSHQPGKGPVTVLVSAAALFGTLGFLGHLAGLL